MKDRALLQKNAILCGPPDEIGTMQRFMTLDPATPVLIGAGQSLDRIDSPSYHGWSAVDLAAAAARDAMANAQASERLTGVIDGIATTRTFEDSRAQPAPFGKSANFPRSVAARLGITPRLAVWERAGGNSPQDLVSEFSARIATGEFRAVLLAGAEAISTIRHAERQGHVLDFSENPDGSVEDRGSGLDAFHDLLARRHGVTTPTLAYALAENARRGRLGMNRCDYGASMGRLFAPFARIAQTNARSAWEVPSYTPKELTTPSAHNRWVADPYPLRLVARDQVNLGAAVVLASLGTATALGVPSERLVYLHGYARLREKMLSERPDLGDSPAARFACDAALQRAGLDAADVAGFDFYSCYPIAVSNAALDGLQLSPDDPRGLTLTGGLPFFGGPGNNYSMHAIAEAVAAARRSNGGAFLVGANGGYLSKYSVGIYSSEPKPWTEHTDAGLQEELDAVPSAPILEAFEGEARVESCTVHHDRTGPVYAIIAARTRSGERLVARTARGDGDAPNIAHERDVLGESVVITRADGINLFGFPAA